MKSKKILTLIFAVLLVFSLFGCGKKEPVEDVEPQDTTEQLDENIKNDISGTYELSNEEIAKYYEYGYLDAKGTIMQSIQSLKSKAKACAEKLGLTYSDAQAFDLFAYGTAIEQTKETIRSATDFIYPSDGLQQFISWREQYEADTGLSVSSIGNAGEVSNEPDTSDPGAYEGGQPDDTVYDPATGEDKAWYPDDYEDVPTTVYTPDVKTEGGYDYSGLGYGISG